MTRISSDKQTSQSVNTHAHLATTITKMSALGGKKRVFDSVFTSRPSTAVNLSQSEDQLRWNRSWRTVTKALNLPPVLNITALNDFSVPTPDHSIEEAIKDIQDHATRIPLAIQTPDIILWYTNEARRHYLSQILPLILRLKENLSPNKPLSPESWVRSCIQVLEATHNLYADGLRILLAPVSDKRSVINAFRLNLSTIVSNSISDRSAIRALVMEQVGKILKFSEPENELLGLVKALRDVSLGDERYAFFLLPNDSAHDWATLFPGLHHFPYTSLDLNLLLTSARFQIMFAEVMNEVMKECINMVCGGVWDKPLAEHLGILPRAVNHTQPSECTTDLCEWIENKFAKLAVQVFGVLDQKPGMKVPWETVDKWKEMGLGYLGE